MAFWNRKKNKTQTSSISDSGANGSLLPASQFYIDCVEDYHNTAYKQGMAKRGLILIPELIPIGEKTLLAFLQDPFFSAQFGNNPHMFYYVIMSLSIQVGIVYAAKWHEEFSTLKNVYVDQIIEEGPADACKPYLSQLGLTNSEKENAFYRTIFERWLAKHEPYWKLKDPREYTFMATLAAYQLGISMILEKYGYGKSEQPTKSASISRDRNWIENNLKTLEESAQEFVYTPDESINVHCWGIGGSHIITCDNCGRKEEFKYSVYFVDLDALAKVCESYAEFGVKAKVRCLCKRCAQASREDNGQIMVTFLAKGMKQPVVSYPVFGRNDLLKYNLAYTFLAGSNTLNELTKNCEDYYPTKISTFYGPPAQQLISMVKEVVWSGSKSSFFSRAEPHYSEDSD